MKFGGEALSRVFVVWVGPARIPAPAMSESRSECLDSIYANIGLDVVLVTDENVGQWVVPHAPLHPAFLSLSAVHKSDYLRSYLLHHHGGGYTDIKRAPGSWQPAVELLNRSTHLFGVGYPEINPWTVAPMNADRTRSKARRVVDPKWLTFRILQREYLRLIGNGAFLFRPGSSFTSRWFSRVNRRMDHYADALAARPAQHPLDALGRLYDGEASDYPIPWTDLMGNVFHPLCLRYSRHLGRSLPQPDFTDYR